MHRYFIVVLLILPSLAQAKIYQCLQDGQISYQDRPCPENADSWREIGQSGKPVGEFQPVEKPIDHAEGSVADMPEIADEAVSQPAIKPFQAMPSQTSAEPLPSLSEDPDMGSVTEEGNAAQADPAQSTHATTTQFATKPMPTPFQATSPEQLQDPLGYQSTAQADEAGSQAVSQEAPELPLPSSQKTSSTAGESFSVDVNIWGNLKKGASLADIQQIYPELLPGTKALGDDFDYELLRAERVSFNGHVYTAMFFFDHDEDQNKTQFTQLRLSPGNFTNDAENQQTLRDDIAAFREQYGKEASNKKSEGGFGLEHVITWALPGAKLILKLEPFMTGQSTYSIRYIPQS